MTLNISEICLKKWSIGRANFIFHSHQMDAIDGLGVIQAEHDLYVVQAEDPYSRHE
jgi:hypothetical protein